MVKIAGKEVSRTLHEDVLVLPRGDEEPIVVRARAIPDFEEFNQLCPVPKPPGKLTKDGWQPNIEDDTYKKRVEQYGIQRVGYMVINSLFEFEWDSVDMNNPKTWGKWEDELKEAGFTNVESNLIMALVLEVNSLDDSKLKAARESFLRGQAQEQSESSSQNTEQESSPSGEHVSD